jgi:dual specificity phosphatase 12
LDQCIEFIDSGYNNGGRVLVLCSNGNNRAATIAAAWLMHRRGWTLQRSLEALRERRPGISIAKEYVMQLQGYEQRINGEKNVFQNP